MATSMPKGEKKFAEAKRVVVFVPLEYGYLIDLVTRYQCVTKKKFHEEVFWAGVEAMMGVSREDIENSQPTPLPRGTAAPGDLKKLAQALIADR